MATRTGSRTDFNDQGTVITWTGMAGGDNGSAAYVGDLENLSGQAVGDGTSVALEGSNDGVTWAAIGAGISMAIAAGTSPITNLANPRPRWIRPVTTGGTATAVHLFGAHTR